MTAKTAALFLSFALCLAQADACTTVFLPASAGKVMAKSYDWTHDDGMVVVNKRGVAKTAFSLAPNPKAARWVSRYGSVTFNQHGREFPLGGINEAGLAVEIMWLAQAAYPPSDSRPEVNELQWIQYQLDNFAGVAELAAAADKVNIAKVYASVHYLACDKTGACASVEFLNGRATVHTGRELPAPTLTNDPYEESAADLKRFSGFGGDLPIPSDSGSLSRFVRASSLAREYAPSNPRSAEEYAFGILSSVAQAGSQINSQWNIVYSLAAGRVSFRTASHPQIETVDAGSFDYSCSRPVRVLALNQGLSGDVTGGFADYTEAANRKVVERGLKGFGASLPPVLIDRLAGYPDTTTCAPAPPREQPTTFTSESTSLGLLLGVQDRLEQTFAH